MSDVLFLEKKFVEGSSCATYLISDDKLPASMNDVELKIKPEDLNTLRRGNTPTPDAPWIGILLGRDKQAYALDEPYLQAVLMTGARIKLIHYDNIEAQCRDIHGILLIGGFFPTPSEWYVKPSPDDELPTKRTGAYISLIQIAEKKEIPILGICGGMQMLAGFYGAKLCRKIKKSDIDHRHIDANQYAHSIIIEPKTILADMADDALRVKVNSRHSEAIETIPADKMVISAKATDGVIEAIELKNHKSFALGVQWHPERMAVQNEDFASEIYMRLTHEAKIYKQKIQP